MRRATVLGLTFVLAVHSVAAQDTTRFGDEAAQNLFVRSRAAVAHAGTVTQLRSLMLRGHLRTMADNGAPLDGAIEIKVLLPDSFLRIETYAAVQRFLGFSGKSLLTAIREGNRIELPPEKAVPQMLRATQAHFTRLMLGVATYITSDRQMTIRSSGGAAAMVDPRDSARAAIAVIDAAKRGRQRGGDEPRAGSVLPRRAERELFRSLRRRQHHAGARATGVRGRKQEPTSVAFGDRRTVGGFDLPYLMTTTVGGRTLERVVFDEILVNPELSKADFRIERK